jgi:hypothetical protein
MYTELLSRLANYLTRLYDRILALRTDQAVSQRLEHCATGIVDPISLWLSLSTRDRRPSIDMCDLPTAALQSEQQKTDNVRASCLAEMVWTRPPT